MRYLIFALALLSTCGSALAEPQCTKEPKENWLSEGEMRSRIAGMGYVAKVFKVTKGNCYEIYGHDKVGKRIEVYFNPVTGSVVSEHRS
jgi:hypothetical protein